MRKTEEKQVFWEEIRGLIFGSVRFEMPDLHLSICVTQALECERVEFREEL